MYNDNYDYYSIWSFSKIEGNHVEGVWSRSGGGVNRSYPIFGRCDFNKLYIYTQGTPAFNVLFEYPASYSLSAQEIFVFQIGQNGRVLTREKFAYSLVDGSLKWRKEPEYNVDLDSRKNYVVRYSSTGFISKTDDYIGEERKSNTPASQTLTEKLKELKDLLNQNIISQEEYDTARKKLLEK
ncbi:MAG: SHOCT domain-containing protein [Flavobacteriia bacterium]|nr:SHOCT domain-containing protein [Flavobacteriia bacterium]